MLLALVEGSEFTLEEIAQFRELLDKLEADQPVRKKKGGKP